MTNTNQIPDDEKVAIAISGGYFDEQGEHSWIGKNVRKGKRLGKVVRDQNGMYRMLSVRFYDLKLETISLNNVGKDPEYVHEYEWYDSLRKVWYRF